MIRQRKRTKRLLATRSVHNDIHVVTPVVRIHPTHGTNTQFTLQEPRNRQSSRGFSIQIFSIKVLSTRAEFNPVGVGFLTDKYQRDTSEHEEGSRFDPARAQGADYRRRYWNNTYFDALDVVRPVAAKLGISTAEAALRWVRYHSQLRGEHGDAIIIGASSAGQLEKNLTSLENGPLPDEMIKALDEGWAIVKAVTKPYFT